MGVTRYKHSLAAEFLPAVALILPISAITRPARFLSSCCSIHGVPFRLPTGPDLRRLACRPPPPKGSSRAARRVLHRVRLGRPPWSFRRRDRERTGIRLDPVLVWLVVLTLVAPRRSVLYAFIALANGRGVISADVIVGDSFAHRLARKMSRRSEHFFRNTRSPSESSFVGS